MVTNAEIVSAYNGFIPQATGMVIGYIREPENFPVNSYVQLVESPETTGLYAQVDRDTPARVVTDDEFAWEDGSDRPNTPYNQLTFNFQQFRTRRRDYPFRLGMQAIRMAENTWKPLESHVGMASQQAMTNRTYRVSTLMETVSNWGNNTSDANTLNNGGGTWDKASDDPTSANYNAIKNSISQVQINIGLATNNVVKRKDLRTVISPNLAKAIGNSPEIHNYVKYGPFAKDSIQGDLFEAVGVPKVLYGMELVIEDAVRVSDRPQYGYGTQTQVSSQRAYIKSDSTAWVLTRQGGIDGLYMGESFSTVQLYWFQYLMAVEVFADPENQVVRGHVVEQYDVQLPAPESGWLITTTLAA